MSFDVFLKYKILTNKYYILFIVGLILHIKYVRVGINEVGYKWFPKLFGFVKALNDLTAELAVMVCV
jgi:hypothetical protein